MVIGNRVLERRAIAAFHCCGSVCCHPTWTERPTGRRLSRFAAARRSIAICDAQPNLRVSGHSAPLFSIRMRLKTRAPGADGANFSSSAMLSNGEKTDAGIPRFCNRAFALDRIAEREPFRRDVKAKTEVNLARTC